jgi:hypothetical protein
VVIALAKIRVLSKVELSKYNKWSLENELKSRIFNVLQQGHLVLANLFPSLSRAI